MALTLTLLATGLIVGLNILATRQIASCECYEMRQKRAQYAMIWIVPIVGAMLAISLARGEVLSRVSTNLTDQVEKHDVDLRLGSAGGSSVGEGPCHD